MGKILSIDYGLKRCGLAITDELQLIAFGLDTVTTNSLTSYVVDYCRREKVDRIIIGLPRRFSGELSDIEHFIQMFIEKLQKTIEDVPISRVDERFSSKIARHTISVMEMKKKQRHNKALVDKISATIILQSYLNSKIK